MHGTRAFLLMLFSWISFSTFVVADEPRDDTESSSTSKAIPGGRGARTQQNSEDGIQFPVDREVEKLLAKAERAIQEKEDWLRPTRWLQSILERKEDVFVRVQDKDGAGQQASYWASARSEANRLLGTMPAEGLDFYELQYGGRAQSLLAQAQGSSDASLLAAVGQTYQHTRAGAEANDLLATYHLDRGRPLAAAHCYNRLVNESANRLSPLTLAKASLAYRLCGDREQAEQTWQRLAYDAESASFKVDGETINLERLRKELDETRLPEPAVSWDWAMFRGNTSHTAQARGSVQNLRDQWQRSDLPHDPRLASTSWVAKSLSQQEYRSELRTSAFYPIAAAGKLIYRGFSGIDGLDPKTGRLLWTTPLSGGLDALAMDRAKREAVQKWFDKYRQGANEDILYQNALAGCLSADSAHVYAVDDLLIPPHAEFVPTNSGHPEPPEVPGWAQHNVLLAVNLTSGGIAWQRGNPAADSSTLAGSRFLGPPLPLNGKLYVLVEKNSELRLACLDPAHGEPLWTQGLAFVPDCDSRDVARRIQAAHPAYGEGVLVCPTNAGAILAVDPLSRTLLWARRYGGHRQRQRESASDHLQGLSDDWKMSAPIIHAGKVIVTSPDDSRIHCLSLANGAVLWQADRRDDLYLAGIVNGKVLLVGKHFCRALCLEDGRQLWQLESPVPSGQGIAVGPYYHVPLEQGAVGTIDVEHGAVMACSPLPGNEVPGNLLFADGRLVSRTKTGIHCYLPTDVEASNSDRTAAKANP
jgi:outer membrane protein assembly factor BamB